MCIVTGDFCAVPGVQPRGIHVVDTEPPSYILSPTFCEMSSVFLDSGGILRFRFLFGFSVFTLFANLSISVRLCTCHGEHVERSEDNL